MAGTTRLQNFLMRGRRRRIEGRRVRWASLSKERAGGTPPYLDPARPVGERVEDLLGRMTLEEKVGQMSMPPAASAALKGLSAIFAPLLGTANERLLVPPLAATGTSRGATFLATAFPVAMARGASWDPDLERRVHAAIGREARAVGANVLLSPCINLLRHPGWGRAQETYGEDPCHLSRMAAAAVRGIQEEHVMAQPKHFALNSIERDRFHVDVLVGERTLREVYLPHFEAAVGEAGAASVMSAYNKVNGQYAGEHRHLLSEILKGEWGFDGFVMSDWIWGTRSTEDAANNGLDVEAPAPRFYGRRLIEAVKSGKVPVSRIDDSARRVLRKKIEFGLFERPPEIDLSTLCCEEHIALARESASKGMVLLKNDGGLLPLDGGKIGRIALLGRFAKKARLGDMGSSWMRGKGAASPLAGLARRAGGARIDCYAGRSARKAARLAEGADAVVVVASLTPRDEGEWLGSWLPLGGDRERLGLPEREVETIRAATAVSDRVVVVVQAGGAVTMSEWIDEARAVLLAWYPGKEGGRALADVLFGDVNPGGKLPFTIPRGDEQPYPLGAGRPSQEYGYFHGYRYFDKEGLDPLFPFGFGLSYTGYGYADLRLSAEKLPPGGKLEVSFELTNEGERAGEEIAQLYVSCRGSTVPRPVRELKGFLKTPLRPGETKRVGLELPVKDLAYYDEKERAWKVERRRYEVRVGPSSRDLPLAGEFEVVDG